MDAIRARFGSALEWAVAAAFLVATLTVGSLIVRELRAVSVTPARVEAIAPAPAPVRVPTRAISVPVLLLLDGKDVRVGDTAARVSGVLGAAAEIAAPEIDRGALGERITRSYAYQGTKFVLVFEPFERNGDPRVAAIYIQ